jgi:lipid-A-disaccharide synthase
MPLRILVSAGEASGDLYASELVRALARRYPTAEFFGCAGPRMRAAGVQPVVDAASLSVVGLIEVVHHIPRIYGEFKKLLKAAKQQPATVAILTDSPDFHLRLARKLNRLGIPVVYFVAPQVWAWREGRTRQMRRNLKRLMCIFPFEQEYFRRHGIAADYIGHPLTRLVHPTYTKEAFFRKHGLDASRPLVTLLPGSRLGEVSRHLRPLAVAADSLKREFDATMVLATPPDFSERAGAAFFRERIGGSPIQVIEGETWDTLAHADAAIAASGTVTVEAAMLSVPMVTFYQVTGLSWALGRFLVRVPYYSMVNLVAGRKIVPEFMQRQVTGESLAAAVSVLLKDPAQRTRMRQDLGEVTRKLASTGDPIERAADIVSEFVQR